MVENRTWGPASCEPVVTVPSYVQRSRGDLGGENVTRVKHASRPKSEIDLTMDFVDLLRPFLLQLGSRDSPVLDEASTSHLNRYRWQTECTEGWESANISIRQPLDMPDSEWKVMPNFVCALKFMSEGVSRVSCP